MNFLWRLDSPLGADFDPSMLSGYGWLPDP